jgi:hypothetical protein
MLQPRSLIFHHRCNAHSPLCLLIINALALLPLLRISLPQVAATVTVMLQLATVTYTSAWRLLRHGGLALHPFA